MTTPIVCRQCKSRPVLYKPLTKCSECYEIYLSDEQAKKERNQALGRSNGGPQTIVVSALEMGRV